MILIICTLEDKRCEGRFIFPFFFLLICHPSYFHFSLFPSPQNSGSPSRARDPRLSSSSHCHATAFCPRRSSPHRQIKLESLTRHAGNRHIYLYLRPIRFRNPGIFLKFLRSSLVPFSSTILNLVDFLFFFRKFRLSWLFFVCSF